MDKLKRHLLLSSTLFLSVALTAQEAPKESKKDEAKEQESKVNAEKENSEQQNAPRKAVIPEEPRINVIERDASYYSSNKVLWIDENEKPFFIVKTENTHSEAYGKLLIIPDINEKPMLSNFSLLIDNSLSVKGWDIYHLYLPEIRNYLLPSAVKKKSAQENSQPEKANESASTSPNDGEKEQNSESPSNSPEEKQPEPTKEAESSTEIDPSTKVESSTTETTPSTTPAIPDLTAKREETYSRFFSTTINYLNNLDNTALFILVKGKNSELILKALKKYENSSQGIVFFWPNISSLDKEQEKELANAIKPHFLIMPLPTSEHLERWRNIEKRREKANRRIRTLAKETHTDSELNFLINQLHGWLKTRSKE
ncbi:DUF3530 family protein [Pleionea sp. CnH1-48]|uniref:DUF3530 family protein n=1 Tax=Pleionea sp. CnH1-48 TaxID=2954494 RepID=UPI002097C11A|nr:DUF3530 family protein [Pleionea sp. CnH1-48]MCO7224645.1 DUF3530 family protein [Pleionea sp. CnH1-48]